MIAEAVSPVVSAAWNGLGCSPKTLPPWLFYDAAGSQLFERITELPEYYLTRTERALIEAHAERILLAMGGPVSIAELGAGTATKTGVLLRAACLLQHVVLYQPIDVSPTALDEAKEQLEAELAGVVVRSQVANYVTEAIRVERVTDAKVLALYIGSSIGNFSPEEARAILRRLRSQLQEGDALLLGTDLAPGAGKRVEQLVAAYDDAAGVTAAFNLNVLTRLNREVGANFEVERFRHEARWNAAESRIEMHLVSEGEQTVTLEAGSADAMKVRFEDGESIHTENSYKFDPESVRELLEESGFSVSRSFVDEDGLFALTLAAAV
jgi:L-histidine N-alpha-methyltransferase